VSPEVLQRRVIQARLYAGPLAVKHPTVAKQGLYWQQNSCRSGCDLAPANPPDWLLDQRDRWFGGSPDGGLAVLRAIAHKQTAARSSDTSVVRSDSSVFAEARWRGEFLSGNYAVSYRMKSGA
jgi:hypothetical protein